MCKEFIKIYEKKYQAHLYFISPKAFIKFGNISYANVRVELTVDLRVEGDINLKFG